MMIGRLDVILSSRTSCNPSSSASLQIQDDQVDDVLLDGVRHLLPARDGADAKPVAAQIVRDQLAHHRIVVDRQDVLFHHRASFSERQLLLIELASATG